MSNHRVDDTQRAACAASRVKKTNRHFGKLVVVYGTSSYCLWLLIDRDMGQLSFWREASMPAHVGRRYLTLTLSSVLEKIEEADQSIEVDDCSWKTGRSRMNRDMYSNARILGRRADCSQDDQVDSRLQKDPVRGMFQVPKRWQVRFSKRGKYYTMEATHWQTDKHSLGIIISFNFGTFFR